MKVWYHCAFGQVKGPFSLLQMDHKIQQGEIKPEDLIYQSGEKKWLPVKDRWQFQKSIVQKKNPQIPKQDWTVLKKASKSVKPLSNSDSFQYQPYSLEEIKEALHQGIVSYSDWVWTKGMKRWKSICSLPLFHNKPKKAVQKKPSMELGQVSDSELLQSVVEAQPAQSSIASLMDEEDKPSQAQGPNLAKSFGNFHFHNPSVSYQHKKRSPIKKFKPLEKSQQNHKLSTLNINHTLLQRPSKNTKTYNKFKDFSAISLAILVSGFVTLLFFQSFTIKTSYRPLSKIMAFQYDVLNNGRELQFWIKEHPKETMLLKISNVRDQVLSTNDFQRDIQIHLNQDGKAVLRLDHWGLAEGYYRFLASVGDHAPLSYRFFVGMDENFFTQKLLDFHQQRQQERRKIENIMNRRTLKIVSRNKKLLPQGMKKLYGQVRKLEKGYSRYRQDVTEWKSFYSSWENSFQDFQANALGSVKEQLDLDLMQELQTIEKDLQIMSEKMDQAVRNNINKANLDLLSPQIAVFLEKVKNNNTF